MLRKKNRTTKDQFLFLHAPKEIIGSSKVEGVVFGINEIQGEKVIDTGKTITIPCDLVISAVGYESLPYEGVVFEKGRIKNTDGRVCKSTYVVGWAKRGPSGVIGTNKSDASDVVALLLEDLGEPKSKGDISDLISGDHLIVDQSFWSRINEAEVKSGEVKGKPRLKATTFETLIELGKN